MNLKEIYTKYKVALADSYEEEEVQATFYIIAEHVSGITRSQFIFQSDKTIGNVELECYQEILVRLQNHEPLQYILEEAYFYGLKFKVSPAVLIPRPETEELVELAIKKIDQQFAGFKLLDIGTGTGCIAISLKRNLPGLKTYALDISSEALAIAEHNAKSNDTEIIFISADIRHYQANQKFDMIISNPPYITQKEDLVMDENVMKYEPHLALFVADSNPLEFYIAIADFSKQALNQHGLLFFEINANYGKETARMLDDRSFIDIQIVKDMQGKDRFITAKLGTSSLNEIL